MWPAASPMMSRWSSYDVFSPWLPSRSAAAFMRSICRGHQGLVKCCPTEPMIQEVAGSLSLSMNMNTTANILSANGQTTVLALPAGRNNGRPGGAPWGLGPELR